MGVPADHERDVERAEIGADVVGRQAGEISLSLRGVA
jgi:hypothetical protein